MIYLDLDGVLVDFMGPMSKFLDIPRPRPETYIKIDHRQWKALRLAQPMFWHTLPTMPQADKLWQLVRPYHPSILTAAPPEWPEAATGKRAWVRRHLPKFGFHPGQQVHVVERHEKRDYAVTDGQPNLLIDDYDLNIREWRDAGGVAVFYTPDWDGLMSVTEALANFQR